MEQPFCKNMNILRTQRQYTFSDLSDLCRNKGLDISAPTLQRYEVGKIKKIPYDSIVVLAEIFNVSPAKLVGWENFSNIENYTDAEKTLIKNYRQLSEQNQQVVITMINSLLSVENSTFEKDAVS